MPGPIVHRFIRTLTRAYPFRTPSSELNVLLGKLGFNGDEPLWVTTPSYAGCPAMELNVASDSHRKFFYFPKAYARFWAAAPFTRFLERALDRGDTFVDIGANVGIYTMLAASRVGATGHVYAFEPEPLTFRSLTRNVELNVPDGGVRLMNLALSNQAGELDLYRTNCASHSLVSATEGERRYRSKTTVAVTRFDDWIGRSDLEPNRIRLIKVDVEGEEARTLEGMVESLGRGGLPPIWCEVRGPRGSKRAPDTFAACLAVLRPLGYRAYLEGGREVAEPDLPGRADVLFAAR